MPIAQRPSRTNTPARAMICLAMLLPLASVRSESAEPAPGNPVLTENGSWGYNGPHAVYSQGKLFYSYMDTDGMVWVASEDVKTGGTVRGEAWKTYKDLHQASSIVVRKDGRIQVFVNKRGVYTDNRIFWVVSEKPGDVSSFGELQSSAEVEHKQGRQFYPLLHQATGDIYVVLNAWVGERYHAHGPRRVVMWRSSDGGDTFDEYHVLYGFSDDLKSNRSYTRAFIEGDDIHFATNRIGWQEHLGEHHIGSSEGIYYTRYNIAGKTFHRASGETAFSLADTPVYGVEHFDVIWNFKKDADGDHRGLWSDIVAKDGRPYIAYAVQKGVPRGQRSPHIGYWATPDDDGKWRSSKVAQLALGWDNHPQRKNYSIAIDPESPDTVYVAMCEGLEEGMSRVHRMRTNDKGATWESAGVLSEEARISTVLVPWRIDGTDRKYEALWMKGLMSGWTRFNSGIHAFERAPGAR